MKSKILLLTLLMFTLSSAYSQNTDTLLARLITNLRSFYELNPSEKCFLHADKHFYQPGETVYFKTYLTLNNRPSSLSNIVYTDFGDLNGNLFAKSMWKANNSSAEGSIFIPDTLQTGIYRIRSYSLWMLNEPASIAEQYIFVLGKKDQAKTYHVPESEVKVEFFPESGQLVNTVINKIAFRITDNNKLPARGVGVQLVDENKQLIAAPLVFENSVGMFEFTPAAGKKYQLQVSFNLNNQKYVALPAAIDNGITLNVSNLSASKVFIQANASESFIDQHKAVYILAQQNGKTVFVQKFNLDDAQNATVLNKKNLTEGLLQVTAFNAQLQPLAERWIWVQQPSTAGITLSTDSLSFNPKGKNKYTISLTGIDTADISVAVIPADLPAYDFVNSPDIKAYHYIHSANNGTAAFVNSFNNIPTANYAAYLDALLVTIKPTRFSWQQIASGKQPALNYFFETGISVRGIVKKDKESMLFDSSRVDIITKGADSSTTFSTAKTDAKGIFAVNDLNFWKSASVYVQATTKEKKKRKVGFELQPGYLDTLSDRVAKSYFAPLFKQDITPKQSNNEFIKNYSVSGLGKELTEIVVKGKNKAEVRLDSLNKAVTSETFRNSEFTKEPDANFSYISFAQLFEQEFFGFKFNTGYDRVAGLDGSPASGLASGDMISYYLDERPIAAEELNFINPNDVALIKVNRNANLHLGQMGPGPSVLIYTRSKGYRGRLGFDAAYLTGYSIPLRFYNPDFSRPELQKTEDRRTTLLWYPNVKFVNGKATIQFYNNDYSKRFKVVIQGIDKNGNLYYLEKIIE
ncbi:MAG: hypothetical protein IPK31_18165 [Chitinophagaceae bacterium]|nr:hypothetical protein [Chitinophagaceae bacterium]